MTVMMIRMTFRISVVVAYGCKTVAHKKPQASNKEDPSCPIKMMTTIDYQHEDDNGDAHDMLLVG